MRRRILQVFCALTLVVGAWLGLSRLLGAQPLGLGTFYVAIVPGSNAQSTLRVVTSATPQQTQAGCESFRETTTTINGLQFTGAPAGSAPTIAAIACQGGDTNIGLNLRPVGTGSVNISGPSLGAGGTQFYNALTGTCSVSAPSALAADGSEGNGQVPCTATGLLAGGRIWVQAPGALEAGLVMKGATVAANSATLRFVCVSQTTCPATAAQTYFWLVYNP